MQKIILSLLLACSAVVFAQETKGGGQFWLHAGPEVAHYGRISGTTFGGGLSAGYSIRGGAFIAKAAWFGGTDGESVLEFTLSVRFWLSYDPFSGGFIQFQAGPVFYASNSGDILGAEGYRAFTIGFAVFGYRFNLGNRFYIEPVLRTGYPYLFGASISAGVRF